MKRPKSIKPINNKIELWDIVCAIKFLIYKNIILKKKIPKSPVNPKSFPKFFLTEILSKIDHVL